MSTMKLALCPFAHIDNDGEPINADLKPEGEGFYVECDYCLARGPWGDSEEMAAQFWNDRAVLNGEANEEIHNARPSN